MITESTAWDSSSSPSLHVPDTPGTSHLVSPPGKEKLNDKPWVSLVVPAYNEAAIIEHSLTTLCHYMTSCESDYQWELIVVNDGSTDQTGKLAEDMASVHAQIRVLHHPLNRGIGQAFRTALTHCTGAYIVTLDLDLSYAPEHISELLGTIRHTGAKIVVTSPYMLGGRVSNVPWLRHALSRWANRFLSLLAPIRLSTFTGMVRAYDTAFLKQLDLRSMGMEVNPEALHKAILMGATVAEIPAHLHWRQQRAGRQSSLKIVRHILAILRAGFVLQLAFFFCLLGLLLLGAGFAGFALGSWSALVLLVFLTLAIQLLSLSLFASLGQYYFQELFQAQHTQCRDTQPTGAQSYAT